MIRLATFATFAKLGVLAVSVSAALGCASSAPDDTSNAASSEEQELSASTLRARSHIQLSLPEAGDRELTYEPNAYPNDVIPYEGLEIGFVPEKALEVTVTGAFPSTARILVVDSEYRVLASGRTEREVGTRVRTEGQGVAVARVAVPRGVGVSNMKVLVRDARWDRTMKFNVDVRR